MERRSPTLAGLALTPAKSVRRHSPSRPLRVVAGLLVSAVCLFLVLRRVDLYATGRVIAGLPVAPILGALCALAIGYLCRILRWRRMLMLLGHRESVRSCAVPYLGSIALNNVLFLRVGDLFRVFVFPARMGVPSADVMATLVYERYLDLMVLALMLSVALNSLDVAIIPPPLKDGSVAALWLALALSIALMVGLPFVRSVLLRVVRWTREGRPLAGKVARFTLHSVTGLARIRRPWQLLELACWTVLVWAFEIGVFFMVLVALERESATAALLSGVLASLSTLIPSSPGYVGPYHLAAYESFVLLFSETERAAAFAVSAHMLIWLPTTIVGWAIIARQPDLVTAFFKRRREAIEHAG